MDRNLRTALENFKQCANEAPEGCYEEAKQLNEVIGVVCTGLMKEIRGLVLKANACDLIFEVEAALYDYVRRSNPDATIFPAAEGFGSCLNGPARDRVLAQAARSRDFLSSLAQQT